jgi:hypothetical protein
MAIHAQRKASRDQRKNHFSGADGGAANAKAHQRLGWAVAFTLIDA